MIVTKGSGNALFTARTYSTGSVTVQKPTCNSYCTYSVRKYILLSVSCHYSVAVKTFTPYQNLPLPSCPESNAYPKRKLSQRSISLFPRRSLHPTSPCLCETARPLALVEGADASSNSRSPSSFRGAMHDRVSFPTKQTVACISPSGLDRQGVGVLFVFYQEADLPQHEGLIAVS